MKIIFVADDEPSFVRVCERVLRRAGYGVVTAGNGAEALRVLEQTSVDLLLTDLYMPERDGFEIIAAVRRKRPDVRIVAMSGGSVAMPGADVLAQSRLLGAAATLRKPFTDEELLQVVAATLAGPS